ncbi:MAG: hypothetical protein OXU48_03255 [candidate division Zixibacteria bacterium]|nr:hypothetical protein [candidate division Zixibacteria bacterium]
MNKPQVIDHTDDIDQRVLALESDVDAIKTNYEGLTGTMQKSFARVAEDIQDIRDLISKVITHTNERFKSMDDKIQSIDDRIQSSQDTLVARIQTLNDKMDDRMQSLDDRIHSTRNDLEKSFRDDLRDCRREIKEDAREVKEDVKEDIRNSVNGLRWTVGVIVALAVAVMKLLP